MTLKKMFNVYGEILSVFIKAPEQSQIDKLPEEKRKEILDHQFAFITFKEFSSAARVVNEVQYLKQKDKNYNNELISIVELTKKKTGAGLEDNHLYAFACFLMESEGGHKPALADKAKLNQKIEDFKKILKDNDDVYLIKDKEDRLICCQALKKRERVKRLKLLYEKIKKQIREKYKFCNLYVKNFPDEYNDVLLKDLFSKYGNVRSCKTVKKRISAILYWN